MRRMVILSGAAGTPAVTPRNLSTGTLQASYYPKDRSSVLDTANAVYQLNDLSGKGRHAVQASGSNQLTYSSSIASLNNKPGLIGGVPKFMSFGTDNILDATKSWLIVYVFGFRGYPNTMSNPDWPCPLQVRDSAGKAIQMGFQSSSASWPDFTFVGGTSFKWMQATTGRYNIPPGAGGNPMSYINVLVIKYNGLGITNIANYSLTYNGVAKTVTARTTGSTPSVPNAIFAIDNGDSTSQLYTTGDFGELNIFSPAPSDADIATLESTYLPTEWGPY